MTIALCSKGLVSGIGHLYRSAMHKKSVKVVPKPKCNKVKPKVKNVGETLPKGVSMQGEERVMMSHTTIVNGKPVTKTFMKARKYHTDPKTGKVIEENITPSPKEIAGKDFTGQKDISAFQNQFHQGSMRFHEKLAQMQQDLRNLWKFPF